MHLYFWTTLTAILLTGSSGTPLQVKNTLVPLATPNITTLTANEINPDHHIVAGTDIWLQVLRPYGALLPNEATLSCLTDAIIDIGEVIAEVGDKPLHSNVTRVENDIKIFIQVLLTTDFVLSTAIAALRGVYELMIGMGGPGSRAITVVVNDQYYGTIGRIDVSSDGHASGTAPMLNDAPAMTSEAAPTTSGPGITDNEATLAARATISMTGAVANLTSANITGPLTPDHYIVPGTSVYVSVIRPYGHELPHKFIINLLLSAVERLANTRKAGGDVLLPMDWSHQERGFSIVFNPRTFNRPHLSTMQSGVVGLIDLMGEETVVGTKEISYVLGVESQGDMGIGYVKWEGSSANGGNATLQGAAATVASLAPSSLLSLEVVETGLVGTS